jgi:hypothetical protein
MSGKMSSAARNTEIGDTNGRNSVLAALHTLPAGQRSLLVAARQVDLDAEWD